MEHEWFAPKSLKFECCRKCGAVRRQDDSNLPCPGVMHINVDVRAVLQLKSWRKPQ